MSQVSPQKPPTLSHLHLVILLDPSTLDFYLTEPLALRKMCHKDDLTRWTFPSTGLPAVREQMHVIDNTITPTNEPGETDYDQILDLIDSYV